MVVCVCLCIRIPTLFEGDVDIKVKPGTQSGHRMRLRGKGVPSLRGAGVFHHPQSK